MRCSSASCRLSGVAGPELSEHSRTKEELLATSRAVIAGAVLGAGLIAGGLLIQSGAFREANASPGSPRLLEQVVARIGANYVDSLSVDDMYRKAASGLVKEIDDPYSTLLTPERYKRLMEVTTGRYAGVGLELDMRDGAVTVVAPLAGTPADSAGARPGDRIVTIDGKPTVGMAMEDVQLKMRGAPGTRVTLGLDRGGARSTLTLTRRMIVYHPVQRADLINGIGYLRLATFSEQAASEVRRTVDSLRTRGARALILDLRANPGGLLGQGIAVADLFLDRGQTIASTRGRTPDADQEFDDQSPQRWPDMPIVALVDSGTASAAEIVAGALQDDGRAVVVGSNTYGKGSAQSIIPIAGGNALKLTTARWFTPNGTTIERDTTDKGGITPDVEVKSATAASDPVVQKAVQLLTGVKTPAELRARVPRKK